MMNGIYISGYFTEEDRHEIGVCVRELQEKGITLQVRNLAGTLVHAAFDFADFELVAVAYPLLREFLINGGYDIAKHYILKLWELITKGHNSKPPFTLSVEGIPTTNGPETIKVKASGHLSKEEKEKIVDKTFDLAKQIEDHQYQLMQRNNLTVLNGRLFMYKSETETVEEFDIYEEIKKRSGKIGDIDET